MLWGARFAYYLDLNVLVFIVLLIAADATRQAGSTDAGLLVTALEQTNLEVAGRTVTFDLQPGSYRHHHW